MRLRITGRLSQVQVSLVSGVDVPLGTLAISPGDTESSYKSRFMPGAGGFRVMIVGADPEGFAVQRMHAPLFMQLR